MRFVVYDKYQVGILDDAGIHDISSLVPSPWNGSRHAMNYVVEHFDRLRTSIERLCITADVLALNLVRLLPPIPVPLQLLAAPVNNHAHRKEMAAAGFSAPGRSEQQTPREVGFFLKAPGSIVGPADAIELPPLPGRRFDHEGELALVIGRRARAVKERDALTYVFGYTGLIDVTLRASTERREERPMRKSFASFSPVGPTLVTADEVPDPGTVRLRLWVNEELRQEASTQELIVSVPELIEIASHVLPLEPGDLYTTGSPAGVGPIHHGDKVSFEVQHVGRMTLPVRMRDW